MSEKWTLGDVFKLFIFLVALIILCIPLSIYYGVKGYQVKKKIKRV